MLLRILFILFTVSSLVACKKHEAVQQEPESNARYFSIVQFAQDEWMTFHGQPYTLQKTTNTDGKIDSSYESALKMDWGNDVLKTFFATDISDGKYLGHYKFNAFDDDMLGTRTYAYDAIDDDLFTRKLYISFDPTNKKIVSIYIETQKQSNAKAKVQKLLYKPLKLIQIQEFQGSSVGAKMETEIKYRFL